jgi:hypothetical protein
MIGQERSARPWWARLAAALGIATILVLTGFLYVATRPGDVALALKFTPGQTVRYRVVLTMNGTVARETESFPYQVNVEETVLWRVESVDAQGIATVDLSVEDGTVTLNGQARPSSSGAPATLLQAAPDGRILSVRDPGVVPGRGAGAGFPGLDQLTPILPTGPVSPGSSWLRAFDQAYPLGAGTVHYTTANRFVRYEDVGQIRTAVVSGSQSVPVEVTMDANGLSGVRASPGPGGDEPTIAYRGMSSVRQTAWVEPRGGALVKMATMGTVDMAVSFRDFPSLFPTFDPGSGPGGIGPLLGGGPPGSVGAGAQETLVFHGSLSLQMQRL